MAKPNYSFEKRQKELAKKKKKEEKRLKKAADSGYDSAEGSASVTHDGAPSSAAPDTE